MEEKLFVREQLLLKEVQDRTKVFTDWYDNDCSGERSTLSVSARKVAEDILSKERMSLDLYGIYYETDKASLYISKPRPSGRVGVGHDYLRYYEMLFAPYRFQEFALVELGCDKGASLRMWQDYFPEAAIVGVDISDSAKAFETERIRIVVGDAASRDTCVAVEACIGDRKPLIILDDASHAWSDQRRSLEMFWEILAPGGFYVIEDLECSARGAYEEYVPQVMDAQPFFDFVQDRCQALRWPSYSDVWQNSVRHMELPEAIRRIEEELDACLFIHGAVILRKR